ncbi:MAG TPA: hypothetical protein VGM66_06455 [Candidatus Udaeobacter sp.]
MRRLFLSGMLLGVMITAAFTYVFAIPANNYYWQTEIWNRGGGAWTTDFKNAHSGWKWKWLVEPIPDTPVKKPVVAPPSQIKVRSEQL